MGEERVRDGLMKLSEAVNSGSSVEFSVLRKVGQWIGLPAGGVGKDCGAFGAGGDGDSRRRAPRLV
jgi:hypothetical protein